jgi:hypothetical protein
MVDPNPLLQNWCGASTVLDDPPVIDVAKYKLVCHTEIGRHIYIVVPNHLF